MKSLSLYLSNARGITPLHCLLWCCSCSVVWLLFVIGNVDDLYIFQEWCAHLPYGGHLSIWMPKHTKPIMILGQDECIFKQYPFSKGFWTHLDGTKQLIPKEEGQGHMLLCFCSHKLGFGFHLSYSIIDEINIQREHQT